MALGVGAIQEAGYAVASRVKLSNLVRSGQIVTVTASALAWKVALAVGSVAAAVIFIKRLVGMFHGDLARGPVGSVTRHTFGAIMGREGRVCDAFALARRRT